MRSSTLRPPVANGGSLPKDLPPYSTVQGYFYAWSRGGIFASLNYSLVMASREAVGREAIRTILFGMLVTTPGIFALAWMSGKRESAFSKGGDSTNYHFPVAFGPSHLPPRVRRAAKLCHQDQA